MKLRNGLLLLIALWSVAGCGDRSSARQSGGDVDLSRAATTTRLRSNPTVERADSLIRVGRHWRATALLAPLLSSPASASPELRLAGARAASGWDGWSEVDRMLRGAPWLDRQFGGEGRELLVRSELERGNNALLDAKLALADAGDDASRVTRRVLLARAYDRANQRDSAEANYRAAASRLPRVADWLNLRAAGVMADEGDRAKLFARIHSAPARARLLPTDAQARERSGDLAGAARVFRQAGYDGSAFRVDAMAARDEPARADLVKRIVTFLGTKRDNVDVRQSIEVFERLGTPTPSDALVVARAAESVGLSSHAVAGFSRAAAAGPLSPNDRMLYAGALAHVGRNADAARVYATLSDAPEFAPVAAYQGARTLMLSGDRAAARAALRQVATQYATVPVAGPAAAPALLLLADLQVDDGDVSGAAQSLKELIARFPGAAQTPLARFRAGLIDLTASPAVAAQAFDAITALRPANEEAMAARYWAGRAYDRLGRRADADERWRAVIRAEPLSYYAMLSSRHLSTSGWSPPTGADTATHLRAVDSAVARIAILQRLGMDVEANFEIDALVDRGERSAADAPAVAQALVAVGEPARAVSMALKAIGRGDSTRALFRLAYPVVHEDALVEASHRNGLDPALVAGLIRQESTWNPRAVSPAAARGLMQLMPSVGASIAASRKYPLWNPALLFDPDVSIELGTAHLSSSLRRDTPVARALAAYNAGASRVTRWIQRPGADDAELFAEWIPYSETRDYVRVVQKNAAVYRALYGLK